MNKQEAMKKAHDLAQQTERDYSNCAQCVLGAIKETMNDGVITNDTFKAVTALAGGGAQSGSLCGALSGGMVALSAYTGRDWDSFSNKAAGMEAMVLSRRLTEKFKEKYDSQNCWDVHVKKFGRSFNTADPEQFALFKAAGAYENDGCPKVCGDTAQWVMEILFDEGIVS